MGRFSGPHQSRSSTRRTRSAASKNPIGTLSPIFAANALKERRSGVRLSRLADLPAPLVQLTGRRGLLGEGFGPAQANYRASGVALVKERHRAQARHTIPSVFARVAKQLTPSRARSSPPPRSSDSTSWRGWTLGSGLKNVPIGEAATRSMAASRIVRQGKLCLKSRSALCDLADSRSSVDPARGCPVRSRPKS